MNLVFVNIEMLFMCFLFAAVLFAFQQRYWRPNILNPLSAIYMLVMAGCILEGIAFYVDGKVDLIWLNYLSNILYLSCIALIGGCMLTYSFTQFPSPIWKNQRQHFMIMLPLGLEMLLLMTSPWTGLIIEVDETGFYHRTGTFFLQMLPYAYLLVTTGMGIYWYFKSETIKERKQYLAIAAFSIPVLLFGSLQLMVPPNSLDIMLFSMTLSLLANFAVTQNNRITTDPLTKLSNREALDAVLQEKMGNGRKGEKEQLYVCMGDIDGFKKINDTYGHLEGDRALILTSDILAEVATEHKAFAARFGGDEFVLVIETSEPGLPAKIIEEIGEKMAVVSKGEKFDLCLSMGITAYRSTDTIPDILKAADRELYRVKKEKFEKLGASTGIRL